MPEAQTSVVASPQLALSVGLQDEATLENFYPRRELAALLAAVSAAEPEALQFVHGAAAVGKSHLLQALCHRVPRSLYLPLGELKDSPANDLLKDLEQAPLIAIDDLQQVAGRGDWEEALFHLINRARLAACPLWFAANRPPSTLGIALADLRSRLAGGVTWAMPACGDEETSAILQFRAARRGLSLPDAVVQYLCARDSRALDDLMATLVRLDQASLQLQRPLTVPLVKSVMGW
jgi:DnaA family protein